MTVDISSLRMQLLLLGSILLLAALYCFIGKDCSLLTADQKGYSLYKKENYSAASAQFADPMWKGVALFKQGEFKEAAGLFAGYDTAEAAFNQGNSLVMLGKYNDAVERYSRALELNPGWEDASTNLKIAKARAEMLKKEGGDMTGGKMEADEIVFSKGKSSPSAGEEVVEGGQEMSDSELRALWLRNVQTKPADFLRSKFAYQHAMGSRQGANK